MTCLHSDGYAILVHPKQFGPLCGGTGAVEYIIWAAAQHFLLYCMCAQLRLWSACASAQANQSLRCALEDALDPWLPTLCSAKNLIRLRGSKSWSLRWMHMLSCRKCCFAVCASCACAGQSGQEKCNFFWKLLFLLKIFGHHASLQYFYFTYIFAVCTSG